MHKSVILALALVACSLAAPVENSKEVKPPVELDRPSPINPDIPSDPKPEEKITLITDPKVQPLVTPTPAKLPGPLVLPRELLVRAKRDKKDSSESDEKSSEEENKVVDKNTPKPSTTPDPSTTHASGATIAATSSSSTPVHPTHPKIPYAPHIHHHNEHLFKPTTETHLSVSPSTSTTVAPSQNHANDKRDIPVPLTRKIPANHDHETKQRDEPSPLSAKLPKEKTNQEEENAKDKDNKPKPVAVEQHPTTFARPIPVAELFAKKPSTE